MSEMFAESSVKGDFSEWVISGNVDTTNMFMNNKEIKNATNWDEYLLSLYLEHIMRWSDL